MEDQGKVALRWSSKSSGKEYRAHLKSDGSLRMFAQIALLNLPSKLLPTIVFLEEPELGLYPTSVSLIGGLMKALSSRKQVVVATKSPLLIDAFELDEMVGSGNRKKRVQVLDNFKRPDLAFCSG